MIDKFTSKQHNGTKKRFPCNTWFDDECKFYKREVNNIARKLKDSPNNPVITNIYWNKKKFIKG